MRLWSVHPKYLDKYGLIALWREGLLAQKALSGGARGYQNNPQLQRFKSQDNPLKAIGSYLCFVASEALRQGYRFNHEKILYPNFETAFMKVDSRQLLWETEHLKAKLKQRDKLKFLELSLSPRADVHPVFYVNLTKGIQ